MEFGHGMCEIFLLQLPCRQCLCLRIFKEMSQAAYCHFYTVLLQFLYTWEVLVTHSSAAANWGKKSLALKSWELTNAVKRGRVPVGMDPHSVGGSRKRAVKKASSVAIACATVQGKSFFFFFFVEISGPAGAPTIYKSLIFWPYFPLMFLIYYYY